jgi:2-polyprenyl-3-methyl-5-hydroxy-6-metoxy-1,4-benzoquinol methylase
MPTNTQPSETPAQEWNSSRYAENARFVSDLGQAVFDLLNPQPGEHILDLGCGDGALTEKIVAGEHRLLASMLRPIWSRRQRRVGSMRES